MSKPAVITDWLHRGERGAREALLRVALWFLRRPATARRTDLPRGRPLRVLFIREGPLGDLIVSLGAVRAVAGSHRETTVDIVTSEPNGQALRGLPYVRRVVEFPRGDRRLAHAFGVVRRLGPYDAVVDGMLVHNHVRTRSIAMMLASRARVWVGESGRRTDWVYDITVSRADAPALHLQRQLRLAAPFLPRGAPARARPLLSVSPAERAWAERIWSGRVARRGRASGPRILVNVSASSPVRWWPDVRFAAVVAHLVARVAGARIVVVGMPRDAALIETLARAPRTKAVIPDVRQLVALVATSGFVVTPDTAVCHIASAFATPLVSLHVGGTEEWWPYRTPGRRITTPPGWPLRDLPVHEVLRALDEMVPAARRTPSPDLSARPARR